MKQILLFLFIFGLYFLITTYIPRKKTKKEKIRLKLLEILLGIEKLEKKMKKLKENANYLQKANRILDHLGSKFENISKRLDHARIIVDEMFDMKLLIKDQDTKSIEIPIT